MIGLLENRYSSEVRPVQTFQNAESFEQRDIKQNQKSDGRRYPVLQRPATAINYATRKPGKKSYFVAPLNNEEKEELSDALLGGIGVDTDGELGAEHSIRKQEVPDYDKGAVKEKDHKNHQQQKNETTKPTKDGPPARKENEDQFFLSDKEEVMKEKEEMSTVDNDEISLGSIGSKKDKNDQITGMKRGKHDSKKVKDGNVSMKDDDALVDEEFSNLSPQNKDDATSKVSEPATVRSILARAKEVLQTLDTNSNKYQPLEKRENIATKNNATEDGNISIGMITMPTNLTSNSELGGVFPKENASNPIVKNIMQQTASAFAITKPKPGVKKTALPQMVPGFGNTP